MAKFSYGHLIGYIKNWWKLTNVYYVVVYKINGNLV
jgi:hypothetical protein